MKRILKLLKNKFVIAALVLLVGLIAWIAWKKANAPANFDTAIATVSNVVQVVSATGNISALEKADLSFGKGGIVSRIYVSVGDHVSAGQTLASLDSGSDDAALMSAQASLADMQRPLTPAEKTAEEAKVASAKTSFDNARRDALNALQTSYTQAQGAVVGYADTFFTNPQSATPVIAIHTDSDSEKNAINFKRIIVSDTLRNFSNLLTQISNSSASSSENVATLLSQSNGYLSTLKDFMTTLSGIVNRLTVANAGVSQSQIDAQLATMNSGLSALNQAIQTLSNAQSTLNNTLAALTSAKSNFDLKVSGNSAEMIAAQIAKVNQASAEAAKDRIVAPIDGVITKVVPNEGEFIGAGQAALGIISDVGFKIEAYIPEADIAKIVVGDMASTTLDAYGQDVNFPSKVISIDPAETILEGVPTYKVTLQFLNKDDRIRSGMTANLDILTAEKTGVLAVPYRAITNTDGVKTVEVVNADGKTHRTVEVTTGLRGSSGTIEIVSGLEAGDKVVTYIK